MKNKKMSEKPKGRQILPVRSLQRPNAVAKATGPVGIEHTLFGVPGV
jgi:hypothetical protein